jgi:hypothetical protein
LNPDGNTKMKTSNKTVSDPPAAAPRLIFAGVQRGGGGIGDFFDDPMNNQEGEP